VSSSSDTFTEKSISEISKADKAIEIYAHVAKKKPFIIDDGSGQALVNGACSFKEGDIILVIGRVTFKETGAIPEIDPIVIKDMSKLDIDLHNQLKEIKAHIIIEGRDWK
jgi:hypothetical protein